MNRAKTARECLYALAVMSGVLRYCPQHETYYRGDGVPRDALPYYDRHREQVRQFFGSPVAFHTALKHAWVMHPDAFCPVCVNPRRFTQ